MKDKEQLKRDVTAKQAILRISTAVEDAPYVLDAERIVRGELAASCGEDFEVRRFASCRPPA